MTRLASLESVWRYPAKSMMGDSFPSLPVDERRARGASW
jgi:hypothetical protein